MADEREAGYTPLHDIPGYSAAWLARLTGGQEVGSSNLPTPIELQTPVSLRSRAFVFEAWLSRQVAKECGSKKRGDYFTEPSFARISSSKFTIRSIRFRRSFSLSRITIKRPSGAQAVFLVFTSFRL